MCHSHAKNKINRLHGRCLRIIYKDKVYTFEQLLEKDSSVPIHTKNLRFLAVEMFKRELLKMCHLKHRLGIFLFCRKIMFRSQDFKFLYF